jgi:hypothetical protein
MAIWHLCFDLLGNAAVIVLAWRLRKALRGERSADKAGEVLCAELAELKEFAASQAALVVHLEHCNYHLACQVYGKEQVDKATRDAASRGTN